jgi:RNA-directed DNA polymerase
VRYADDCNIYVRSAAAGQRVMKSISDFITRKLKLKVNQDKSAVDRPSRRKFLGFTFSEKKATVLISRKALQRFKERLRQLTRRGVPALRLIGNLNCYLRGWVGYFGQAADYWMLRDLDSWIRRRLRSLSWRAWRTPRKRYRELTRRGVPVGDACFAVRYWHSPWHASSKPALQIALPNRLWHDQLGLLSLLSAWHRMHAQS